MGYAFINMLRPDYVGPLVERFNNRKWEKFNSEKVGGCSGPAGCVPPPSRTVLAGRERL